MGKDNIREVPVKNYFILGIILIISFILLYYLYMLSTLYNETKLNVAILDKYMEVINYNELDDYLVDNGNAIIYVSVLEDNDIREFEKKFKNVVKNNELDNNVLYMDISEDIKDSVIKKDMDNKYMFSNAKMSNVPSIVVFENGKLKAIYSVKDNDYDIERTKIFINYIKFSSEDNIDG